MIKQVKIKNFSISNNLPIVLIAGPCQLENREHAIYMAENIKKICSKLKINFIYKTSYDKANRTSHLSKRGLGLEKSIKIFDEIKEKLEIPILTDVHSVEQCEILKNSVDIIQIPAFLCRQTDLLVAAAKTGKPINIKKGQFMSAETMKHAVTKIKDSGNNHIILTDRGTMFGYQDIIVDYRGIPTMQKLKIPVVLDITHSLQKPNQSSGVTGGNPEMIETIAKAGVAAGADGIFLETHPNPKIAKSDGENMLELNKLKDLLTKLIRIRKVL